MTDRKKPQSDILKAQEQLQQFGRLLNSFPGHAAKMPETTSRILQEISDKLNRSLVKHNKAFEDHKGIVEKTLGLKTHFNNFFYDYLCIKYGHLTIDVLSKMDDETILNDYANYSKSKSDTFQLKLTDNIPQSSIPELHTIFKTDKAYQICLEILNHFEADTLTDRQGGKLFAIIDTFKIKSSKYLKKDYSDNLLLQVFNSYLGKDFKQIKKDSLLFRDTKDEIKKLWSTL